MQDTWDACALALEERRVLDAMRMASSLMKSAQDDGAVRSASRQALVNKVEQHAMEVRQALELVNQPTAELELLQSEGAVQVYRAPPPSRGQLPVGVWDRKGDCCIAVEAIFDARVEDVLTVLRETGLYSAWLPGMVKDACETSWSKLHDLPTGVWARFFSPVPVFVNERDVCVQVRVYDCLQEAPMPYVLLVIQDSEGQEVPPTTRADGCVRMNVHRLVVRIAVCGAGGASTRLSAYFCGDPCAGALVPTPVQRFLLASGAAGFVSALCAQADVVQRARARGGGGGGGGGGGAVEAQQCHRFARAMLERERFYRYLERRTDVARQCRCVSAGAAGARAEGGRMLFL